MKEPPLIGERQPEAKNRRDLDAVPAKNGKSVRQTSSLKGEKNKMYFLKCYPLTFAYRHVIN